MYDVTIDEFREVTQADIDAFQTGIAAFGMLRLGMIALLKVTIDVAQGHVAPFDVAGRITGRIKSEEDGA